MLMHPLSVAMLFVALTSLDPNAKIFQILLHIHWIDVSSRMPVHCIVIDWDNDYCCAPKGTS